MGEGSKTESLKSHVDFEGYMVPLGEHRGDEDDLFRVTVRTICSIPGIYSEFNYTGLMTHSEVRRADLPTFWLGVNAVARTWQPNGIKQLEFVEANDNQNDANDGY